MIYIDSKGHYISCTTLIACDESGTHGVPHYGFGSLWLKWQRRGDFLADYRAITENHGFEGECKWSRATRKHLLPFYEELITYFFKRQSMVFHCIVVRKEIVQKEEFHNGDWDLARRKHFTMLLTSNMKKALRRYPNREHEFRVYVDPIASRYSKADEAVEVISNNILNQRFNSKSPVKAVLTKDSKETPLIQLCDLMLGAVMETWHQRTSNPTKLAIRDCIAKHLGWDSLSYDTLPTERKFNIWYFHDPMRERRQVRTEKVNLLFPYDSNRLK
ncbi:DUF3800 domain-containing protein [Methylophaga sp.]|uniref:DUF3800 domain-containing protein n=1 Tax=Methylophaga sp. TaxID=2024840 RepID=UPI003A8E3E68